MPSSVLSHIPNPSFLIPYLDRKLVQSGRCVGEGRKELNNGGPRIERGRGTEERKGYPVARSPYHAEKKASSKGSFHCMRSNLLLLQVGSAIHQMYYTIVHGEA